MQPGTYVVEHKTTSYEIGAGSPYWKRLTLDSQVSNYLVGARTLGHEPAGVLYDVVRKVRLRPSKATPVEAREYTKLRDKACPECKKKKGATPAPHLIDVSSTDVDGAKTDPPKLVACSDGRIVTDPGGRLYATMREFDETADEYRERVRADIGASPEKYFQRGTIVRLEAEEREAAEDTWTIGEQIRESRRRGRWRRNLDTCDSYGVFCSYWPVCAGEARIEDPTRYRDSKEHEELEVVTVAAMSKKRLPILSTSSARSYGSCPRKYFYAYELRRRAIADSDALRFGTLFHIGLEVWWQTVSIEAALAAMRAAYQRLTIEHTDAICAEELMLGYHVRWKDEALTVLDVEKEFSTPLINPETGGTSRTFERGGKIDAIVRVESPALTNDDILQATETAA